MVAAVVLAAGAGTRFVGPVHKLRARLGERTVIEHSLGAARASGLDVFVVSGAVEISDLVPAGVVEVHNPRWADGQATSARLGIAAAAARGHTGVVIGLGDQPFLLAEAWTAVAASTADLAVATYDGIRGHPVRIGEQFWGELPTSGDAVGRDLMARHRDVVEEIACVGQPTDIDTLEELSRWS